ncbi:hypothetical protein BH20ACT19_BH20ACT19_08110 [soil metagenome]
MASYASTPPAAELNRLSVSATLHCMTGCVIGEVLGLTIGTALGWSDLGTIALLRRGKGHALVHEYHHRATPRGALDFKCA